MNRRHFLRGAVSLPLVSSTAGGLISPAPAQAAPFDRSIVRQLARDANRVSDELFAGLRRHLEPAQIVTLTAFGGMMVAMRFESIDLPEPGGPIISRL